MNKFFFLLILLFITTSCQSVKDALQGKKYENSDEFLVIKKNPLILPPNFSDLPTPEDVTDNTQIEIIQDEIEDLLSSIKDNDEEVVESSSSNETESFVLEKIQD